ncbi:unnamed protein product, partial [Musa acuminata subsp. burmannicoides]
LLLAHPNAGRVHQLLFRGVGADGQRHHYQPKHHRDRRELGLRLPGLTSMMI